VNNLPIKKLVVHCSATRPDHFVDRDIINEWHKKRGFNQIGYHFVILRDGTIQNGRPPVVMGAHAKGHNKGSLGICLVGGLNQETGRAENNYTPAQMDTLEKLLDSLEKTHSPEVILGHRDLSPDLNKDGVITSNEWTKACPCFDVGTWRSVTKQRWSWSKVENH
jgi:N-acetyl-anhydromuramyl-L-alanine amidase AmpD|tara:strand:+ start:14305 stop:14799 length:495 start_codon:yes stop_codon:yes gene_type:complete